MKLLLPGAPSLQFVQPERGNNDYLGLESFKLKNKLPLFK